MRDTSRFSTISFQHASANSLSRSLFRRRGFRRLELSTSELQPAALALYRNSGYVLVREIVAEQRATEQAPTAWQAHSQWREQGASEAGDADSDGRERDIRHLMRLLDKGLPLGDRRFTRDEMHEQ